MPRYVRNYCGRSTIDEAKNRLRHCYETFDHTTISWSGGKDSTVLLLLAKEVGIGEGYVDRIHALHFDEETIHPACADFMLEWADEDWLDLEWWCLPLHTHRTHLGQVIEYVQWDPARDPDAGGIGWCRDKPAIAKGVDELDPQIAAYLRHTGRGDVDPHDAKLDIDSIAPIAAMAHPGRYMLAGGQRAAETLMRYTALLAAGGKPTECWLGGPDLGRIYLGKPVYDTLDNDIFKYLHDSFAGGAYPKRCKVPYPQIYDAQMWAGYTVDRVSTVMSGEHRRRSGALQQADPDYLDRLLRIFPDMAVHDRYQTDHLNAADQLAQSGELDRATFDDVAAWVDANLDGEAHAKASACVAQGRKRPDKFPVPYVFRYIAAGYYQQGFMQAAPTGVKVRKGWVDGRYVTVDEKGQEVPA